MRWVTIKDRHNEATAKPGDFNDAWSRMTSDQRRRYRKAEKVELLGSQIIFYDDRGNVVRESLSESEGAA